MSRLVAIGSTGVRVRGGSAAEVGIPTWRLIVDAVADGDQAGADELFDYLATRELAAIVMVYVRWIPALLQWLGGRIPDRATVADLAAEALAGDVNALLGLVDESATDESEWIAAVMRSVDRPGAADELAASVDASRRAVAAGDATPVRQLVRDYQLVHDRLVRGTWGLMAVAQRATNEDAMADLLRASVSGPMVKGRTSYHQLATMTGTEIMWMTAESMRSHFSGPDAEASVVVEERDDRYLMSFDPCGSAGRARRETAGTVNLLTAAEARARRAHDWTWGETEVGLYCAHCAVVNEIMPIEHVGFPKRETRWDPDPNAPCRWVVYKDPRRADADAFTRVGLAPPADSASNNPTSTGDER